MVDRRSVLTAILASLASGATATASVLNKAAQAAAAGDAATQAAATVNGRYPIKITRAMLNDPVVGRYAKTILLQQRVYATNQQITDTYTAHPEWTYTERRTVAMPLHQKLWVQGDELIAQLLSDYKHDNSKETLYSMDDLWERRIQPEVMTIQGLAALIDAVMVVAVLKHSISVEKVRFDTIKMVQFDRFASQYRDIVLDGSHRPAEQIVAMYPEWALKHFGEFNVARIQRGENVGYPYRYL